MTLDEFECEGARRRASRGRCVVMSERRVVLAGGSGFLGRALAEEFSSAGYEVVVLTRRAAKSSARVRHVMWDGRSVGEWARELEGAAAVVNLAGRSVDRSEEHTSELQSHSDLVCRLLLE